MNAFYPNLYLHEAWYPFFLMVFALNFLVVCSTVAIDAMRRGFAPHSSVLFLAGLGSLLMTTPTGLAVWIAMNLALCTDGVHGATLAFFIVWPIILFLGFWGVLLEPALSTISSGR